MEIEKIHVDSRELPEVQQVKIFIEARSENIQR
jgi:hypothetical protein